MCLHRLVVLPLRRCLRIVVHVGKCLRGDDERDDSGNECESPAIIHREGSTTRRALRPCLDAQNASNYGGTLVAPPITNSSSRNGFVVHLWVISRRNRFRDKFLDQPSVFAFRYITALFVTYTGESTSCCVLPRANPAIRRLQGPLPFTKGQRASIGAHGPLDCANIRLP